MGLFLKYIRKAIMTPQRTGRVGETKIDIQLNLVSLFGKPGMILRNIYIPIQNEQTSEIDLLFITRKGLFVIESKYYSGYIFGNEHNQQWTTSLYAGKNAWGRTKTEKHQFYNPIKQNQSHIKALMKHLGMDTPCFSVIVFSDRCELKNITVYSPDVHICQQASLHRVIAHIWDTSPDILSDAQITAIHATLQPLTNQDVSVKKQHIQNINNAMHIQQASPPTPTSEPPTHAQPPQICPLCGSPLVLRTARNGPTAGSRFWGCSRFPSCRYTKSC